MKKDKKTLDAFRVKAISKEKSQAVKGGFKWIPNTGGGSGSNGLVDWGELEIRVDPIAPVSWGNGNGPKPYGG